MAPERSSRHRESGERRHKSRHSRSHQHASGSDGTRSGHSSRQALSMDALAALNEANVQGVSSRDAEEEAERRRRQERRERRKREQRASAARDEYQAVEPDSPRGHRTRPSRSSQPPPPRYEERDADRRRESREGRKHRSSKAYESPRDARRDEDDDARYRQERKEHKRQKRVVASAAAPQETQPKSRGFWHLRGGGTNTSSSYDGFEDKEGAYDDERRKKRFWTRKRILIAAGLSLVIVLIIVIAAVVVSKKSSGGSGSGSSSSSSCLKCNLPDEGSIPSGAPDYLDPFQWYDTIDFNVTYTDVLVGELPIMGLNSTWDDSNAPNGIVPALNEKWGSYADRPARGVNLGGWLSLEPWITPDMFMYDESLGIVDEYNLCKYLGSKCASTLEKHYSSFVTESTFAEIADAGLDHVRIPFSYWAVQTYDDDPYLFRTSWRYLLRGIEWARKYGLRINLDLHGIPGSQNGWNHSGRLGPIGWFNGTNSAQNVQRSVDVHDRLSKFFGQDRYQNIISHYGLCNEPKMTVISSTEVMNWTESVYSMVRANGVKNAIVVFGDGFRGLGNWQGEMTGYGDNMALDVHQYVIFNNQQIVYNHTEKVEYACRGWTEQTQTSMDTSTGFGPTMVAEWSQADTDCATHLNNVGWGNRWTGTYDTGNASDPLQALTPKCPTEDSSCSCASANADPGSYSDDYKQFLLYFAEAQMDSFEAGWGWFYWTWWTSQGSWQWSYKRGMQAGILPKKAYERTFHCNSTQIPNWSPGLPETY